MARSTIIAEASLIASVSRGRQLRRAASSSVEFYNAMPHHRQAAHRPSYRSFVAVMPDDLLDLGGVVPLSTWVKRLAPASKPRNASPCPGLWPVHPGAASCEVRQKHPRPGRRQGDFEIQARQAFENLRTCLDRAGAGTQEVVRVVTYLADASQRATLNSLFGEYFPGRPAYPLHADRGTADGPSPVDGSNGHLRPLIDITVSRSGQPR
ncbi:RidA family protein [Rhodobacter sp. NSM]|uniref:RidA family protein n=1 Tax=Rhodobacter sp. NSM TaxID=3457501 RepID=UPI003FD4170A